MDRGDPRFLSCMLLVLAVAVGGAAWSAPLPFEDGFENVAVGSYPYDSSWLALSFGKSAYVSDLAAYSGSNSFRLDSWPWSARMDYARLDEIPDQLSYQASVYVDPTQGWIGLVGFMTRNGYYAPMWNCFRVDAGFSKVSFLGETVVDLADYTPGTWCTVRADLDYNALTADLWVDGNLLAEDVAITPKEFYEPGIGDLVLSQWGVSAGSYLEYPYVNFTNVVYFDDLSLWPSSTTVEVDIALGAGSSRTYINLRSKGMLSVAVLSTESFDATQIDPATVTLAGAPVAVKGKHEKLMAHIEDVDGDGLLDMTFQFPVQALDTAELTEGLAILTGATYDGQEFAGSGEISVLPRG